MFSTFQSNHPGAVILSTRFACLVPHPLFGLKSRQGLQPCAWPGAAMADFLEVLDFAFYRQQALSIGLLQRTQCMANPVSGDRVWSNERFSRQPPYQWPDRIRSCRHGPVTVVQFCSRFSMCDDILQSTSEGYTTAVFLRHPQKNRS